MQNINWIEEILSNLDKCGPDNSARLLHGRGGCFPGEQQINCDFFSGLLWFTHYEEIPAEGVVVTAPESVLEVIELLVSLDKYSEWVREIVYQRRAGGRYLNLRLQPDGRQTAFDNPFFEGVEEGLKYRLRLKGAMHPGLFTDTGGVRQRVRDFFVERNKASGAEGAEGSLSLLNLFSFTCMISVAALAGGCERSVNVDMKRNVLKRGEDNHRLNFGERHGAGFLAHDVMKSFGKLQKMGPWSLIVVDPPSIQSASFSLERDYPKLLRRCAAMLETDGRILACCNDPRISDSWLEEVASKAGLSVCERLPLAHGYREQDESNGLKALMLQSACE